MYYLTNDYDQTVRLSDEAVNRLCLLVKSGYEAGEEMDKRHGLRLPLHKVFTELKLALDAIGAEPK